jgi:futalosine hydrolase
MINTKAGNFITVLGVSGDGIIARKRAKMYDSIVENMEGYAFAYIALRSRTKAIQIRGISNIAGVRDRLQWNLPLAHSRVQEVVIRYLESLI